MKVLLACEFPSLNGGENSLLSILPILQSRGVQPCVAVPQVGDFGDAVRALGIKTYDFDLSSITGHDKYLAKRTRLAEIVVESGAEVLHANSLSCGRASGLVGEQLRIPTVAHLRDIMRLSKRATSDLAHNTVLIAVSQATKNWYETSGIPSSQIRVVNNGVDSEIFHPGQSTESIRKELDLDASSLVVLSVGQIGYRKGWDSLLDAAKIVVEHIDNVCFVIAGERHSEKEEAIEYERSLRAAADSTWLQGKVRFLGRRTDISELMAASTVFVHPARQEPLGRVLLEAAASGCCILATDVGGTTEIFPAGSQTARVVPHDDPRILAQELIDLLNNSRKRSLLGCHARERMLEKFTISESAEEVLRIYEQLPRST